VAEVRTQWASTVPWIATSATCSDPTAFDSSAAVLEDLSADPVHLAVPSEALLPWVLVDLSAELLPWAPVDLQWAASLVLAARELAWVRDKRATFGWLFTRRSRLRSKSGVV
jgi:hypothetical protein